MYSVLWEQGTNQLAWGQNPPQLPKWQISLQRQGRVRQTLRIFESCIYPQRQGEHRFLKEYRMTHHQNCAIMFQEDWAAVQQAGLEQGMEIQLIGCLIWPSCVVTKAWTKMVMRKMGKKESYIVLYICVTWVCVFK